MKYTPTHEWIHLQDSIATIGITDYAQQELGDVVFVELPRLGHHVETGDEVVVLESTKAAVDIYSPLSGEITEVNQSLLENPERVNVSPEQEGWLFKLKVFSSQEYDALMSAQEYQSFLKK